MPGIDAGKADGFRESSGQRDASISMPRQVDVPSTPMPAALEQAGVFISIGTSGHVYPAAGFVILASRAGARTIEVNVDATVVSDSFQEQRIGPASVVVPQLVEELLSLSSW